MANHRHIEPEKTPILTLTRPFQEFVSRESSGGILLLACTLVALVCANSPWAHAYDAVLHMPVTIGVANFQLSQGLHFWVNEALMAVFFFVAGLEIKRELLAGELATARQAALPMLAALGGVTVPALLYIAINANGPGARGWGIPMATDIAFAIGVMALLGSRAPLGLKVFLTALAIVDDIAAILVIAIFYSADIQWVALGVAGACVLTGFAFNRLRVRHVLPYALIGVALWIAVLLSGVHATLAGVLLAFLIPSRNVVDRLDFLEHGRAVLNHYEREMLTGAPALLRDIELQAAVEALEDSCEKVQPPLRRFEHALHPWVTFLIMPVFALVNAGVVLSGDMGTVLVQPITLGVVFGLVLGKPMGVVLASWLAVRTGLAALPKNVSWSHIHGAAWLAGIGFTMSLFMSGLIFTDPDQLAAAKTGVLVASLCAAAGGSALIVAAARRINPAATQTVR